MGAGSDGTVRILHVDDDPEFAETAAAFLERENDRLTVETAATAEKGLASLSETVFDCIVSDYDMPGQDGIEFLETVREAYPELPFILYTGKGSEEVASDAIAAGATGYLQKERGTGQYTVLANRIETLVDRARTQRRQKRQLEAIETAREGIGILDTDGCYVYVNRAYGDIYGFEPEELVYEHWTTLYPENEAEYVRSDVFPQVEADGYWRGRTTGLRADGTTFTQDCILSGTERDTIICTVQDVSDRVESEKQLNRYRTLVEALEDPVYVLDEDGRFEFANHAFVDTFGYGFDEVLGNHVSVLKEEKAVEQGLNNLRRILSSDGPDSVYFETEIRAKDGESIPCEDHMAALPYEGETFDGSVGILRDISDQKHREETLQRRNQRLDEFASVVSHDLRNPLGVAEGNLELLREECDSELIGEIDRALTRMDGLIEDLLRLAHAGDREHSMEPVDLEGLLQDSWRNVETGNATIRAEIDHTILADRSRLAQVFENLIRNAIEHGGEEVTITVGVLDEGFFFEDDGPGIPTDERDDVFETGYTTTEAGSGFGLSIVKQIVEVHGWEICVTDGPRGGARFEVTGVEIESE